MQNTGFKLVYARKRYFFFLLEINIKKTVIFMLLKMSR